MSLQTVPKTLRWLLVAFLILCLIYAWSTPIFEVSDELWHFGLVDYIANTGQLPIQHPGQDTAWEQEGSQPPLYYLLAAALVAPLDRNDIDDLRQPNPHVKAGVPKATDNKNLVLHDNPNPVLEKTAAAVFLVRLFSIALGMVTVSMVYAVAQRVGNERVALLAAGITAFNPMFLFITASVNNDNLVTALNSVVLFLMIKTLQDGFYLRRSLLIAVLIALATLSKLSGLVLVPVMVLAALWTAYQKRDWRGLVQLGVLMLGAWLLLAGWWYARNLSLYGELFGTATMVQVAGPRIGTFTLSTLLDEFQGFRIAYWGLFGAVNILTFDAFYIVMDIVVIIGLAGLGGYLWRQRNAKTSVIPLALLGMTLLIGSGSVILWTAQTYASQGRLLFPFIAATSSLLALGLWQVPLLRFRADVLASGSMLLLGAFALAVPLVTIRPHYALPLPLDAVPPSATRVYARFDRVALVGYQVQDQRYQPGDDVRVTVYWQALEPAAQDYSLFLTLLAESDVPLGKVDTYPGGGRLRTSTWQSGAIYADEYVIPIAADAQGDGLLRMQVGWWDYPTETYLLPKDEAGESLEAVLLNIGGFAEPEHTLDLQGFTQIEPLIFGDVLLLKGYSATVSEITLAWEALGTLPEDYTVFVQVQDDQKDTVGQGDAPPILPTHYLRQGDQFLTRHPIYYPTPSAAGNYTVVIGWYRPGDFTRLPVDYPDNAYPLTMITIP